MMERRYGSKKQYKIFQLAFLKTLICLCINKALRLLG